MSDRAISNRQLFLLKAVCFLLVSFSSLRPIHAADWRPTYGAEFEFSHPGISHWQAIDHFSDLRSLRDDLGTRVFGLTINPDRFKVRQKDFEVHSLNPDWYFRLDFDYGVLEINTMPSDLQLLRQVRLRAQKQIFETTVEQGFYVDTYNNNSHFNIGLYNAFFKGFRQRVGIKRLFSYMLDFHSHTELASGIFGHDYFNAPPFYQSRQQLKTLNRIRGINELIADFNNGRMQSITDFTWQFHSDADYHRKNEALRLPYYDCLDGRCKHDSVLEIRCVAAQTNFEAFILMAELFELRMNYLKKLGFPLRYFPVSDRISDQEKLDRFFLYVTEAGGDFDHFAPLIWPHFKLRKPSRFLTTPVWLWMKEDYLKLMSYKRLRAQFPSIELLLQQTENKCEQILAQKRRV